MAAPSKKPSKPTGKGLPPTPAQSHVVGNNTTKPEAGELVSLNFKTDSEFKRELKSFAAEHDMTMVGVLKEAFAMYKASKGKE
ncbi:hypothetical protein [Halomonas sp. OfavH-34-E]|uniref:hypothetical protein n=1 Tax=Halomonas sp. OfavH-34-E TaxID=2954491 RepID=UPI0020977823|nr:hypothetical protein [Halomonas sp. OfavH-34-E]MCO7217106.1 hypothetical protein [Halomonas sp. OfavH-34-E]